MTTFPTRPRATLAGVAAGCVAGSLALAVGLVGAGVADARVPAPAKVAKAPLPSLRPPLRLAFYYPKFPETWRRPNGLPGRNSQYSPSLGLYRSSDLRIVRRHIAAMRFGRIQGGIVSWWGVGSRTDRRMPTILKAAKGTPFRFAIHYELEAKQNPSVRRIRSQLAYIRRNYASHRSYLRIKGRFVVFVHAGQGDACRMAARWRAGRVPGVYLVLQGFPGYRGCRALPDAWHQYSPEQADSPVLPFAYSISPGFFKPGDPAPRLTRDLPRFRASAIDMARSGARFQLVTTFNEWGDGSAVESAREWRSASGYGEYLDVLHAIPLRMSPPGGPPSPNPTPTPKPPTPPAPPPPPSTPPGAIITPGLRVYQITGNGLAATATCSCPGVVYTGTAKQVVERSVQDLKTTGGGTIRFAAGTFDLGLDYFLLHDFQNVLFTGAGIDQTTVVNSNSNPLDTEVFNLHNANRLTIRDMTISAGGTVRSTSDAIDSDGGNDSLIERVKITGSRSRGIVFDGKDYSRTADRNLIKDCRISGTIPEDGIELLAASRNRVEGCTITNAAVHGIQVNKATPTANQPNKKSNDNVITGNTVVGSGDDGIEVLSGDRNFVTGNTVRNSSRLVASQSGIRIGSFNSVTCDDNVVSGNVATDDQTPKTQQYGLRIASPLCNRTVVGPGNIFLGNKLPGNVGGAFVGVQNEGTSTFFYP